MMIVGFDGSRAFKKDRTGTENYSYQLLVNLAKIDQKNIYIVYLRPGSEIKEKWPNNFQFKAINFSRLWTQVGLAVNTFKDSLDVLFIPAHTSPLIHKKGLKTVVTVHDLGAEFLPKMHQLKQRLYLKWISNFQLKNATKLIAVSNTTKMDLVKKVGCNEKKIEVIYEGFNEKFKVQSSKFKNNDLLINSLREYVLKPQEYFLFVGTVQPRKNLERLIRAFSRFLEVRDEKWDIEVRNLDIKNLSLVIVGSKGWLSDEIYALPEKLGIKDRVKFLGYVPDSDMSALYSGSIALTYPSLFEGFGLPILEAQACGCPVITSNISSMPEVAGNAAAYVDPYSVDDIVKAMERLQVTGYRLQLIKQGFENIKRFSWEKAARETLKVFENVKTQMPNDK